MSTDPTTTVKVTRRFDVSADRVFDAWLHPAAAARFLFATPSGQMVRVDIDARVGGSFCLVDRRDGEDVEHTGAYLEIDRPRRLVFTFSVPRFSAVITQVSVEIVPAGAGCELALTNDGVLAEWADQTRSGWTGILDGLALVVSATA